MAAGIGLSIGATALAAVVVGRAAVRRSPVLTRFEHRPPEVGVPSENPNLDEGGLIITDFVDRVGDPVPILAADGSSHAATALTADALRALLYALTRGRPPAEPVGVTYPAHWPPHAVDALREALAQVTEFGHGTPLVPDASAALTALQDEPGLPRHGVVAFCDFGGTGTSITLADAADGYRLIGPAVRHRELSGDLIDQALLTHVLADLAPGGSGDLTGTSALGPLTRLRGQCRGAKERLSTSAVTTLTAELPGRGGELRLNRTELDEVLRAPLAGFIAALQEVLERSGVHAADLAAVATAGGGARIPLITTTLSETFRVPVVTTPQPDLSAAIGAGLTAAGRGGADADQTALAPVPVPADPGQSSTFRALAWSESDDIPDVAPAAYDEPDPDPRPPVAFSADDREAPAPVVPPWYRRPAIALGVAAVAVLAALAAAVYFVRSDDAGPSSTPSTTATTTTADPPAPPPAAPPPETPAPQAPDTQTVTQTAPPPPATEAPPPPTTEPPPPPPPTTEPPPPTTTAPPPTTAPPTTTQPPLIPTLPYSTIPGLPFVPAPPGLGGQ
ncbi:Hsp70 family protein [Mycolicibacterium sp. S2-37]|uniref:Hsp70 family protein n=1 Tax=Mycolicibacterium sp. S2-37 TaxID=2810297 RepID=UPI001A93D735|nr:Hsp70 family protein [Mycolicibacterium sp. S2-37]MBO0678333.1 Hsp70 family protein [Mycolicibacterium sp. S2-37]